MKRKLLSVLSLSALLLLGFTQPVRAFDGRSGDQLVIASEEVIDDDLYVTAGTFVLDGTVNGDLIAVAQSVTINGKVDGDVIAVGQTVVVNGTVTGAVRAAGFALLLGDGASTGGDVIAAGYSLESRKGSGVGQDLLFAGSQILLAGDVARHVHISARAFELRGAVAGSVSAGVGDAGAGYAGPSPDLFMPATAVSVPTVDPGITVDPAARVEGNLVYEQSRELAFPAGAVAGEITRRPSAAESAAAPRATTGQQIRAWGMNALRTIITLVLIGLFLLWLFPSFMQGLSRKLQSPLGPSLGWGLAAYLLFFLALLLILAVMLLGGLLFGALTLGGLAGTVLSVGILSLLALILGFVLVTSFVAKIVFGQALGRWLLARASSPLAEHRFWPMVLGVILTVLVIALFRLPPLPGFVSALLNFIVILSGVGALWLRGRERVARQSTAP